MKNITLLIILSLSLCSCKTHSNSVENDLYNCMLNVLSDAEEEQLNHIFREFENHLIDKGILESADALGYWKLHTKMAETNSYNFSNDFDFSEKISFLNRKDPKENQPLIECHNQITNSQKYLDSNLYKLAQEIEALKGNRITPVMLAKLKVKFLSPEDFESPYHKFQTLVFVETHK